MKPDCSSTARSEHPRHREPGSLCHIPAGPRGHARGSCPCARSLSLSSCCPPKWDSVLDWPAAYLGCVPRHAFFRCLNQDLCAATHLHTGSAVRGRRHLAPSEQARCTGRAIPNPPAWPDRAPQSPELSPSQTTSPGHLWKEDPIEGPS